MVRWIVRVMLGTAVLLVMGVSFARYKVETQGSEPVEAVGDRATTLSVTVDDRGIPTIRGRTWDEVLEAEGYHVASQRFFQMELMRRAAGGKLAALFGEKAIPVDRRR